MSCVSLRSHYYYYYYSTHRTVIGDVQMKTSSIQGKVDSKPSPQGNAGSNQLLTHELQDKLKTLSGDVGKLLQKSSVSLHFTGCFCLFDSLFSLIVWGFVCPFFFFLFYNNPWVDGRARAFSIFKGQFHNTVSALPVSSLYTWEAIMVKHHAQGHHYHSRESNRKLFKRSIQK